MLQRYYLQSDRLDESPTHAMESDSDLRYHRKLDLDEGIVHRESHISKQFNHVRDRFSVRAPQSLLTLID